MKMTRQRESSVALLAADPSHRRQIGRRVPWELFRRLLWLPDSSRSMGIHVMAGKGSGKSRLMGRIIAWLDFLRGVPQVVFDPHGPTIDNFLDKLLRLPPSAQARLASRVMYIDMSGQSGYVVPFPLYYRLGGESLYEISQRYLDVVRKIDPFLQTASVEGWNALWRTGTHVGMLLSALDLQITEAESLLNSPAKWEALLQEQLMRHPELQPALGYLHELARTNDKLVRRRTESFFNKAALFSLDPPMKAMFGAQKPAVNWYEIISRRQTVLLDFRHEHDLETRRFKMVWAFNYLLNFVKSRGAGRHTPVGLVIDELTSLFSLQSLSSELFGADLDELINVIARNYGVWLTIAHQEYFQLTERIIKSLMTMGTQILGATTDPDAAKYLAQLFFKYDPYRVKKVEAVYGSAMGMPIVLDYRTVEFSLEEQILLRSYEFIRQGRFRFLAKPAAAEGDSTGQLTQISLANLDPGAYPDEKQVGQLRWALMQQHGLPIEDLLAQIENRLPPSERPRQLPSPRPPDERPDEDAVPLWG